MSAAASWRTTDNSTGCPARPLARFLDHRADADRHIGSKAEAHVVADRRRRVLGTPPAAPCFNSTCTSVAVTLQLLAGADVERHAFPSPRVDVQPQRRIRRHASSPSRRPPPIPIAAKLAEHEVVGIERPDVAQHLRLLVADRFRVGAGRRLHRQQAQHLQQVILNHVADHAGLFVELAAALDAE